jgi:hypothetical protein
MLLDDKEMLVDLIRQLNEQFDRIAEEVAPPKAYRFNDVAKPFVRSGNLWETGGTTKIIELKSGVPWQTIRIFAKHTVTIEHNAKIQLQKNVNYDMVDGDYIELIQKDDGVWYETQRGGAAITSSGSSMSNPLLVGVDDTTVGTAILYGGGSGADGGVLEIYLGSDDDVTIVKYLIQVVEDDLLLGPDTDTNALKYDGGNARWDFTAANPTQFSGAGGVNITGGPSYAYLSVGADDTTVGMLRIYGGPSTVGGALLFYTGAQGDAGGLQYYIAGVAQDDWSIGPGGNPHAFKLLGTGGNDCTAKFSVALDVDAALTATTVDAESFKMLERSADPSEPTEGEAVVWMSDGTGKGDDGDVMIASKAGGTTNYGTLFDHSAGAAW